MATRAQKRAAERRRLCKLYEKGRERSGRKGAEHWRQHRAAVAHLREQAVAAEAQSNGFREPPRPRYVWAEHEVDQGFWHGRRNATRGNRPTMPHIGVAWDLRDLHPLAFVAGHALYVQSEVGDWEVRFCGEILGYAPPAMAMGWKLAAERAGVLVEVYSA